MRRIPLYPLLAAAAVLAWPASAAAGAGDPFDPFGEPETARPPPRKAAEPPSLEKPLLAPMEGRVPTSGAAGSPPPSREAYPDSVPSGSSRTPAASPPPWSQPPPPETSGASQQAVIREPLPAGPLGPQDLSIERGDLAPVIASDGTGLPYELWRGLSVGEIEALFASLEIPPRSPALHRLWIRLVSAGTEVPGSAPDLRMAALRAEALDRSGAPRKARDLLAHHEAAKDPVIRLISARTALEQGDRPAGCPEAKALAGSSADVPPRLKAEAIVLTGYCSAAEGNLSGAGIAAGLARENGLESASGPTILDALALGSRPELPKDHKVSLIEYRMLLLGGGIDKAAIVPQASPALLALLAQEGDTPVRLAAAEAAAAVNSLGLDDLAAAYRAGASDTAAGQDPGPGEPAESEPAPRRAAMFRGIEAERTPQRKTRQIRAFLDSSRRAGFYWTALQLMAEPSRGLSPAPEIGWFAETGIEISLAAGEFERAREWARAGSTYGTAQSGDLGHWLALADIVDPNLTGPRGSHLDSVERMALSGRFEPVLLHRLATVLDALGTHIPVPLWEAASRTPQPASGHLPDTGVLSALQEASKKKEFGHTVLLAMKTLGPAGSEGAHMIALGDSIRALKRAGLEADARALALEALFGAWPRSGP